MTETPFRPESGRPHAVIVGSGFGGLFAAKKLKDENVDVTIIDRTNHHLFQPLLYQVATGILSSGEIAPPTRQIFDSEPNVRVVKGDVVDIDVDKQVVTSELGDEVNLWQYDYLLLAAGAGQSYFGNDHFAHYAPGMKTIDDALEIRARIISAFERAELTNDPAERERLLTFVVVGAGPTGVELAGQIAELANRTLTSSYRSFNPHSARVILLDGAPQVLPPFGKRLGRNAQKRLEDLGVVVKLNSIVTDVDDHGVVYKDTVRDVTATIPSYCKIWSAGVAASPLGKLVADQLGVEVDRAGRVPVNPDLSVGDDRKVFVIGDMMSLDGLPGVAQVAIQGGECVAGYIADEAEGADISERQPFKYFDKGSMATVSRFSAVVKMGKVEVTGFLGWALWLGVHLMFLVGFRNRLVSSISWGLNVLTRDRWQLVSTRQQMYARNAISQLEELTGQDKPMEIRDTRRAIRSKDTEE
ncbi:NAD(P)/FAD-dependent oxidoreductase [Corynebacterium sp. TAE3-ERU12]|uniref:NAD(P)/FAD-dependent oxidoreductase n=1 Tax=Corynebacterium sp. TAE3-ERU12 TaxID=2849491 RepID=UPI001C43CF35|nr:NAD(P)/FAD-dependent oxidoreductase [Corynebacterium sp. TAE3-ERU12]MBV7295501.1 NAD(P)/FAD-dependent oxidoreductase [Corynebacterium sp. TAE3-ERU12]